MTDALTDTQIERWRLLWEEAITDAKWVAYHEERDARRTTAREEMLDLLHSFLPGEIDVRKFRATFDRKTRTKWDVFGLKGLSGAMFLNKLVKHIPDSNSLSQELRTALRVPGNTGEGQKQMQGFMAYLNELIDSGTVKKRQISPGYAPFFLSAWWHLQDRENWPIFYTSGRQALRREDLYSSLQDPVKDYSRFRERFLELASALNLESWELEHLLSWYEKRAVTSVEPVPESVADAPELASPITEPGEVEELTLELNHTHIQWLLAKVGRKLHCRVWIAANDQNREWNGERLGDLSMAKLPSLGLDEESQRVISLIDVLWIRGAKQVVAAFEIEHTTHVYSGLLRMSDLVVSSPNLSFPLYIVAPEARLDKVRRELSRPTFQALELHKQCGFFSFEALMRDAGAIMQWASAPSIIDRLASKVDDADNEGF